ncbi:MAG: tyrosine-type recombinase/integrase [Bacteroidota bacterium]
MITLFVQHLASEKRLSPHTVKAYNTDLKQFADYLCDRYPDTAITQATHQALRAWIVKLAQEGMSSRSINRKIASLKAFYRFLHTQAHIAHNPTCKLSILKHKQPLPVFVKEQELTQLLEQHDFPDTFEGWRDKVVLELLYGTGIRLAELLQLHDADIQSYDCTIKVLGKRNKQRVIPFPKRLNPVIAQYRTHRALIVSSHTTTPFLITATGKPCYPVLVYRLVKKYLQAYTHADQHSPHVLRHTFATHLLHKGADLNAIKDLLGHESLAATQLYTHHSIQALKEIFHQAHPRA